ncbi:transcription termination/antitermination protein NusG [Porphyrobacter sp. LM 6]|uniref:transcription termination/antitermination protein NusG n=1 Tax=Porphyrobacter sp. LM 6 TaxID=1896196 RepID=UPI00084729BB|nr:transcription termination/antitermination NusG family protein [Porphyrobacter sp. LM 6]AOL93025.1 transcriptional antiterminator RfaH [Porphyrobacter sp. LM 6]
MHPAARLEHAKPNAQPRDRVSAWFAVQAKPNAAHIAERNLVRQGFDVFLPLERYALRRGRNLVSASRPYFAGYMFVGFDPQHAPWRVIRSTYGVARLVSFGGSPAPVAPELVTELMRMCDEDGIMRPRLDARTGDRVMVADGPFAGFVGRLDAVGPNERAWLLLDIMGKATRVSIAVADLRRAS